LPDITVAVLPAADIPAGGERAPHAIGLDQVFRRCGDQWALEFDTPQFSWRADPTIRILACAGVIAIRWVVEQKESSRDRSM
jgi:hypothetical protein